MQLHIKKNIQFTRHIKVNGLVREFNFRKISGSIDELFHVDVVDDRGNRIMFRMQKSGGGAWQLVPQPLPSWIGDAENQLHAAIEEELSY